MTRLYLLRHGETDWSVAGRLQGRTDIPLNDRGVAQAEAVASALGPALPAGARVVSSPLMRARRTAEILAAAVGATVQFDERLVERAFGVWEGLTTAERSAHDEEAVERWHHGLEPGIEGYEDNEALARRVKPCLAAHGRHGDAVLVSHGSALRMLLHAALDLPAGAPTIPALHNGTWSILLKQPGGGWHLEAHAVRA